jgi:hypothetical protein
MTLLRPMPRADPVASPPPEPTRAEAHWARALFMLALGFHLWAMTVGWESKNLPGVEYRQAQTAISAFFIKQEGNYSLEYPTPVLGKPWSIPMEFPLYQWCVAALSSATGLGITMAGRLVGIACFYLCLPAIFLLLARWQVVPTRRWLVLAVVVTCPLYVFYARAVLIETMALMFALWFWVGFERAVRDRDKRWLAVAVVAGAGAGLVKVTTFLLFLLPVGAWALVRLWRSRRDGGWRTELAWMAAAAAVPFVAAVWWVSYADAVKARNPMAWFLDSANLRDFNLGTFRTRFSPELWALKWRIIVHELSGPYVLVAFAVLALVGGRARWREIGLNTAVFAAALAIFPVLYAYHDYYFVANTVLLLLAMGLVLVALAESRLPRWAVACAVLTVTGGQVLRYFEHYYPGQRGLSLGGDGLTHALKTLTRPDEYLVITGQDWNSMTAYYAQRRALMLRADMEKDRANIAKAWANLAGEKLGALLIEGPIGERQWLVDLAVARGLEPTPLLQWRNVSIFLPAARREENLSYLEQENWHEVWPAPGVVMPPKATAGVWLDLRQARPGLKRMFREIRPMPVSLFSTFGPAVDESSGRYRFGAHPVTRLVWSLPAGRHVLRTSVFFPLATYQLELSDRDATDGVEVTLRRGSRDDAGPLLYSRLVNPRENLADRGERPLEIAFTLETAGEVELCFGPGPAGRDTRDWISLGPLTIERPSGR